MIDLSKAVVVLHVDTSELAKLVANLDEPLKAQVSCVFVGYNPIISEAQHGDKVVLADLKFALIPSN